MKIEMVRKAQGAQPALWLVKREFTNQNTKTWHIIGQLEKYRDTRNETHPWKAFVGTGMSREYIGAFYGDKGPPGVIHHADPKQAAIDAIIQFYALFEPIAQKAGVETLVVRNLDRLDFTEISVTALRVALYEAFQAGTKAHRRLEWKKQEDGNYYAASFVIVPQPSGRFILYLNAHDQPQLDNSLTLEACVARAEAIMNRENINANLRR